MVKDQDSKIISLEQIKADIVTKNICPDLAKTATQLVFGDGNANAEIVMIGEAPGKKEDEQGLPFVGAAGKFLNEMLDSIGLNRGDIYITNIVKYRPPGNRDPSPEEKTAFLPFLKRQLEVIEPKIVITLGRHSMECFLPGFQIGKIHGQPKRIKVLTTQSGVERPGASAMQGEGEQRTEAYKEYSEGAAQPSTQQRAASKSRASGSASDKTFVTWVVLPLFHPAAALYNGGMRQTLLDDFGLIPTILNKIEIK